MLKSTLERSKRYGGRGIEVGVSTALMVSRMGTELSPSHLS